MLQQYWSEAMDNKYYAESMRLLDDVTLPSVICRYCHPISSIREWVSILPVEQGVQFFRPSIEYHAGWKRISWAMRGSWDFALHTPSTLVSRGMFGMLHALHYSGLMELGDVSALSIA